jgi:hypothetical protein
MLLTDTAFSDAEIAALTRAIFAKGRDYSALGSSQGAQISVETSRIGMSVPMHQAAAKVLDSMAEPGEEKAGPEDASQEAGKDGVGGANGQAPETSPASGGQPAR